MSYRVWPSDLPGTFQGFTTYYLVECARGCTYEDMDTRLGKPVQCGACGSRRLAVVECDAETRKAVRS